jgi:hypothetical protein
MPVLLLGARNAIRRRVGPGWMVPAMDEHLDVLDRLVRDNPEVFAL